VHREEFAVEMGADQRLLGHDELLRSTRRSTPPSRKETQRKQPVHHTDSSVVHGRQPRDQARPRGGPAKKEKRLQRAASSFQALEIGDDRGDLAIGEIDEPLARDGISVAPLLHLVARLKAVSDW